MSYFLKNCFSRKILEVERWVYGDKEDVSYLGYILLGRIWANFSSEEKEWVEIAEVSEKGKDKWWIKDQKK